MVVVLFEIINKFSKKIEEIKKIEEFTRFVVSELKIKDNYFNIIIIDNEEIRKINKEYRGIDDKTDVISFALEDYKDINDSYIKILGDIYISYEQAENQASHFGNTTLEELFFLILHGILHLLGYDHMNLEDEKIMFELQDKILKKYQKSVGLNEK